MALKLNLSKKTFTYNKDMTNMKYTSLVTTALLGSFTLTTATITTHPVLLQPFIQHNINFLDAHKDAIESYSYLINALSSPITLLFAALAVQNGVREYKKNQRWKVREFLDIKFKEFETQSETLNVRKMLDNEVCFVELFPTANKPINRFVIIEENDLIKALSETNIKASLNAGKKRFQELLDKDIDTPRKNVPEFVEAAIRDNFDRFLDYLQQIEVMKKSKIIDEDDLKIYLNPWVEIINRTSESSRPALLTYMGLVKVTKEAEKNLTSVQKSMRSLFEGKITFFEPNKVPQSLSNVSDLKPILPTDKQAS
ncbi:MAG: hypothetical protein RIM23_20390 [Coleofasciculus sp. G3-WIS-01]|uniref:hypothetical protein n=1 Tax=Coleofasciculus sp. G3-WIS-01 TaxID=3069528 RepID=UPI0032F39722